MQIQEDMSLTRPIQEMFFGLVVASVAVWKTTKAASRCRVYLACNAHIAAAHAPSAGETQHGAGISTPPTEVYLPPPLASFTRLSVPGSEEAREGEGGGAKASRSHPRGCRRGRRGGGRGGGRGRGGGCSGAGRPGEASEGVVEEAQEAGDCQGEEGGGGGHQRGGFDSGMCVFFWFCVGV